MDRLSREIQINSNQIIATIVEIARQDASNGSWAVNCFQAIVTSCKQPISTFPEAIPIVELVLEIPESDGEPIWGSDRVAQFVAARLLGASNIRVNDVIQFATRRFEAADRDVKNLNDPVQRQPGTNYLRGIDCLIAVAPHDRKAVRILSDTLRAEWPKVIDQLDRLDTHQTGVEFDRRELVARSDFCFQIVNALKRIQPPAVEAISVLTEIVDSPKASKVMGPSDTPNQMGGMGSGGGYLGAGGGGNSVSLRERIINTIKQIQFANPAAVMTRQSDAELTAKSKPDDEHSKLTVRTLLDMPPLVGYSFLYLMEVTNDHDDAATDVLIEQSRPDNTEITDSLPAYESLDQNRIVWRIKSIGAHETVRLAVKGMPGDVGQFLNDAKGVSANLGKVINPNPSAMEIQEKPQPKLNQPTYDGQAYSEWLRILNTERQPKKLADAMEACGRLVAKGDERLIARGIFQVEAIFEHDNRQAERDEVRNAGKSALLLLPSDDVVAELLNAIRDPISYQNGRSFQAEFLKQIKYSTQVDSYRLKVDEIVNQILKVLPSQLTSRDGDLIAALSTAWRISQRSMSDFDGLSSVLIKVVKDGFSENTDSAGPGIPYNAWFEIVTNIVEREPEAPDLAILLAQHAVKVADIQSTHSSWIIASLIAQLGKHGEPAVPILVDLFLSESKKWEALRRSDWNESSVNTAVSGGRPMREWEIRTSIIGALGQIGIGAKGYELLKQLKFRIIPPQAIPHQAGGDQFVLSVTPAIEAAFKKYSIPKEGESCEVVLTDSLSLNGKWQLKKILSDKQEPTPDFVMNIRSGELLFGIIAGRRGGRPGLSGRNPSASSPVTSDPEEESSSLRSLKMIYGTTGQYLVKLDEATSPKSITLHQDVNIQDGARGFRELEGIYELTDSTFTIQIARAKLPRPKEFAADPAQLPEGNVHLQFERKTPIELQEP